MNKTTLRLSESIMLHVEQVDICPICGFARIDVLAEPIRFLEVESLLSGGVLWHGCIQDLMKLMHSLPLVLRGHRWQRIATDCFTALTSVTDQKTIDELADQIAEARREYP